ncbi:hypothetical protein VN97_g2178 [Penicillium thymicola]|uniref:Uncharacterized protein n=1 Tax=Penicillium thymicola TaxID=293382 RepID=A0AAI9XBK0_PENTH|nr:hypothetical protein VN97_g2178 [Penicillium thymicola]
MRGYTSTNPPRALIPFQKAAIYIIEWAVSVANRHRSNDATMHAIATGWGHASGVSSCTRHVTYSKRLPPH